MNDFQVTHYFADDVEDYAVEEQSYYERPHFVVCHVCWQQERATQYVLELAGWHLSKHGELCPKCVQQGIDADVRPEEILKPKQAPIDIRNLPF